ncbi:hypothetical protein ACWCPI_28570 [Streptomyces sp. NPDC001920]
MSRPPEYENGTPAADAANGAADGYGLHGSDPERDVPQVPPNVYHPQPEAPPAYDAYADPAAAHGWQNAYDETTKLPQVVDAGPGADDGTAFTRADSDREGSSGGYDYRYSGPDDDYGFGEESGRRSGGRRAGGAGRGSRRKPVARGPRRVAMAAGAVGAVSVAALIAGFAMSGSSSGGGAQTKDDRTSPTVEDPAAPAAPARSSDPSAGTRPSDGGESSRGASPSPSSSGPSGAASDDADSDGKSPSPAPTTTSPTAFPTTPTETRTAPGNSDDKPGLGQGSTKKPG